MSVWYIVACEPGYYGKDCNHRCSVNCSVEYNCDKSTGQCIGGCRPGLTGTVCDNGKKCVDDVYIFPKRILLWIEVMP